jgi:hypothetical protein
MFIVSALMFFTLTPNIPNLFTAISQLIVTVEDGIDRLSQNVGMKLPFYTA